MLQLVIQHNVINVRVIRQVIINKILLKAYKRQSNHQIYIVCFNKLIVYIYTVSLNYKKQVHVIWLLVVATFVHRPTPCSVGIVPH